MHLTLFAIDVRVGRHQDAYFCIVFKRSVEQSQKNRTVSAPAPKVLLTNYAGYFQFDKKKQRSTSSCLGHTNTDLELNMLFFFLSGAIVWAFSNIKQKNNNYGSFDNNDYNNNENNETKNSYC